MMKITDHVLMILAGYCLYTLTLVFSNNYFAGVNQWIPELFTGRASIQLGQTFHMVIGSVVTGLFLTRFAPKAVLTALLIALFVNVESYIILMERYSFAETWQYYKNNPMQSFNLLKPFVILPMITFLLGLLRRIEPEGSTEPDQ